MSKLVLCLAVVSAFGLAACGGSSNDATTESAAAANAQAEDSGGPTSCEDVSLGNIQGQNVSAVDIEATGVDCGEAQEVAAQWAAQQVGGPTAKLPAGWHCASDCRKGSAEVSFALGYGG